MVFHLQVEYNIPSLISSDIYTEQMKYVRELCMIMRYGKFSVL